MPLQQAGHPHHAHNTSASTLLITFVTDTPSPYGAHYLLAVAVW